jgi:hypothetical protein
VKLANRQNPLFAGGRNCFPKTTKRRTMCPRPPVDLEFLQEARKCMDTLNAIANSDWDLMARINVEYYGDWLPLRTSDHLINGWELWLDAASKGI